MRHTQPRKPTTPNPVPLDAWETGHPHPRYDPQAAKRYRYILKRRPSRQQKLGCAVIQGLFLVALIVLVAYFLAPLRTNILILGNDARPDEGDVGRTDTMILVTVVPLRPYVGSLSIPRDLWVEIPGQGQNRINTAHFYGEAEEPGSGPLAAEEVIRVNFNIQPDYYIRFRFDGFREVVDALGGVDVNLPREMSGYAAGEYHLTGEQALALVRDRQGSDDFSRMDRAQIFLKAIYLETANPSNWLRLPDVMGAVTRAADTNIPVWVWPRLSLALLRAGPNGIDGRLISREMVDPFTTEGGAAVLGPKWDVINPVLDEMFGHRAAAQP